MNIRTSIFPVILLAVLSACSNTRFLAEDQVLYTGRGKLEITPLEKGMNTAPLKPQIKPITDHKVNNGFLGQRILPPVGLWTYNYWEPDPQKKVGSWLHKTLSSAPVILSDVNPELRAQLIENELFDLGYFRTNAWVSIDTSARNPKKARVNYHVEIAPPFRYGKIMVDSLEEPVDTLIRSDSFGKSVKVGDQFNLARLTTARNELSRMIQNQGYFYFIPDFIELEADTTQEAYKITLSIARNADLPPAVLSIYKIDRIVVHVTQPSDSIGSTADTVWFDDMTILSEGDFLKPDLIRNSVFLKKGEIYTYTDYQNTVSHLNNLGIFNYVRITFERSGEDSLRNLLDLRIDLVMADNINLDFEADLVTKSTGYAGPEIIVGVSHGNAFKGAEKIHVGLNGGFEWQWGGKSASQLGTFSYDLGLNSGLTLPKIIFPGQQRFTKKLLLHQTAINLDFNLLNRTAYYSMSSVMTNLNYRWGRQMKIQHSYSPLYLNSVHLLGTTPEFDSVVNENIYIRKSFEEQFIIGMRYAFIYDNTFRIKPNNIFFQASVNSSGNMVDLFAGMGKEPGDRPHKLRKSVYSQYVKITTDFRYYRNGIDKSLVIRLYAGTGLPYGNSTVLPYVEQFFSGGAYSIRGFTARYVGPGSYHEEKSGYIDQSGDLKLEGNLEYRFGLSKIVKGALFLETGNIWLINEDENRPGAKFDLRTFYNQLAVGTGFGLRFDFSFFVLRTDLGFPLRTPYANEGKYWLPGTRRILHGGLFYLAIGYPF